MAWGHVPSSQAAEPRGWGGGPQGRGVLEMSSEQQG